MKLGVVLTMRKKCTIERIVCVICILLLAFNCFAVAVSDNDGSAFITKAEFDSLKNTFQAQLDEYNSSIDRKIDNAIASYFEGIKVAKTSKLIDEITAARSNSVDNVTFASWQTPADTKHVADAQGGFFLSRDMGSANDRTTGKVHGFHIITNMRASGFLIYQEYLGTNNAGNKSDYTSAYYFVNFPFATLDDANNVSIGNTDDWYLMSEVRNRVYFTLTTTYNSFSTGHFTPTNSDWTTHFYHPTSKTFNTDFTSDSFTKNGAGSYTWASTVHVFDRDASPISSIEHQWSFRDYSNDTTQNNFLKYNISGTIPNSTANCIDFNYRDRYVDGQTFNYMLQKNAPSTSTHTGGNSGSEMYIMRWGGSSDSNWWNNSTRYEAMNDYTFNFKWNMQKNYNLNWRRLTNKYYCEKLGEAYYKYYGIPICKTTNKPGRLKFKLKFTNSRTDTGTPLSFTYQIMDVKFSNGAMPTQSKEGGIDHVLKRDTVAAGNATTTIEFNINKTKIWDSQNNDYIYLKIEPSGATQRVSVETDGGIIYTES